MAPTPDGDASQHDCAATDPDVSPDGDWARNLESGSAFGRVFVMFGAINLDRRSKHGLRADGYRGGIENCAARVEVDRCAKTDVESICAMKRCFNPHIGCDRAEEFDECRCDWAALFRGQAVMRVDSLSCGGLQALEFGVETGVPFAGRHSFSRASGARSFSVTHRHRPCRPDPRACGAHGSRKARCPAPRRA